MSEKLKYPILLVHGMGFRDNKYVGYWGRIPGALQKMGCKIYFGNQDSNADIETNGRHLAERINQIILETGAERVNIIAHSKGGLDCRYAISSLGMGDKVASLTTIATPHHGSKTMDKLMRLPHWLIQFVCFLRMVGFGCWETRSRTPIMCCARLLRTQRRVLIPIIPIAPLYCTRVMPL